ncbi:hypothetical protein PHYPSEUDO_001213 [Phytophthora pseudosyringae]|uniref:PB1 domain-containing protein n=1 Tax=Phytophthora pseudosyringae TaxID=221518 RepID=A0A8T1VWR6_9STRA|nr:hypothetical protein PHYPSEUDO_001213 [Phytophthora pseudosyringae]
MMRGIANAEACGRQPLDKGVPGPGCDSLDLSATAALNPALELCCRGNNVLRRVRQPLESHEFWMQAAAHAYALVAMCARCIAASATLLISKREQTQRVRYDPVTVTSISEGEAPPYRTDGSALRSRPANLVARSLKREAIGRNDLQAAAPAKDLSVWSTLDPGAATLFWLIPFQYAFWIHTLDLSCHKRVRLSVLFALSAWSTLKPQPGQSRWIKGGSRGTCHNACRSNSILARFPVTSGLCIRIPRRNRSPFAGISVAPSASITVPPNPSICSSSWKPAHSPICAVELTTRPPHTPHTYAMAAAEYVVLKLSHAGETYRVTVPLRAEDPKDDLSYELVLAKARALFPRLSSGHWTLVYRDDEGDVVTLSHALEFDEACHVLLGMDARDDGDEGKLRSLHFCVLQRVTFREKVVAPVLQKVVELACLARDATAHLRNSELLGKGRDSFVRLAGGAATQAGVAINHLRNSEVLGRGRESLGNSAAHTRTLLLSARSGVSTRLRRAGSAVAAGIERRRSASGSSFDGLHEFDPTDFVKSPPVAVSSSSSPSSEVAVTVDLRQSVSSVTSETPLVEAETSADESDEEPPALVPADASEQQQVPETVYESDTDTLCDDDDDREWDIVDNSGAEEAIAEADGEWARELEVLRGILVHLDEELCCDLLSQYNGNVEAVLVELTNI